MDTPLLGDFGHWFCGEKRSKLGQRRCSRIIPHVLRRYRVVNEWTTTHPDVKVKFHNWWSAPKTWAKVLDIDPDGSHASWMENFPWTRLDGVDLPDKKKPMTDMAYFTMLNPEEKRAYVGDGNMGGVYQRSYEQMLALWQVAVGETRALLESWGK